MYKSNYSCLMYKTIYKYTPLKRIYRSLDGSEYHVRKIGIYFNYQEKHPSIFHRFNFLRAKTRLNHTFVQMKAGTMANEKSIATKQC